ncbi:MAG: dienelactone hydrolase family protein [Pseudomonadota bacterium]
MGSIGKVLVRIGVMLVMMLVSVSLARAEHLAGVTQITVPSEERGRDLSVTIWYPATLGGDPVRVGENIFFEGTPALFNAPWADGELPLVMLSHGAGLAGRAEAMGWIAASLAEAGFVVAAPTHPGNTGRDRSAEETMKLWLRPSDVSAALDALEDREDLAARLDFNRVGALGLSMGGNTALLLAGARIDPAVLASYCDAEDPENSLCLWVRMSGVDLSAFDPVIAGRDSTDPSFKAAMAMDPALVDVLDLTSFGDVEIPLSLVNLGAEEDVPASLDASAVADAVTHATYARITDASHFSMFGVCKPNAAAIAVEEQIEDPICSDGTGGSRDGIHREMVGLAEAFFNQALRP